MSKPKSTPGVQDVAQVGVAQLPPTDEEFWRRTEAYMPKTKQGVFVRLDADVLTWLRSKGKGYQTRMNAMLRVLMESDRVPKPLPFGDGGPGPIPIDAGAAPVVEIGKPPRRRRPRVA